MSFAIETQNEAITLQLNETAPLPQIARRAGIDTRNAPETFQSYTTASSQTRSAIKDNGGDGSESNELMRKLFKELQKQRGIIDKHRLVAPRSSFPYSQNDLAEFDQMNSVFGRFIKKNYGVGAVRAA